MHKKLNFILACFLVLSFFLTACSSKVEENKTVYENLTPIDQLNDIWEITGPGEITWNTQGESHIDHIEMSGLQVSGIVHYGTKEDGSLELSKRIVWPMLRTIPNDTHASLIHKFEEGTSPVIIVNGTPLSKESPRQFKLNGSLSIVSSTEIGVDIERETFPSTTEPVFIELITVRNNSEKPVNLGIKQLSYEIKTIEEKGVYGIYTIEANCKGIKNRYLEPGEEAFTTVVYSAIKKGEEVKVAGGQERMKRKAFVQSVSNSLNLETPDPFINEMFRFAKIRTTESIYSTKGGLMHGPGGGRYYAAIWANDQAEYVNPFFPFLGNENGNESAINSFRHFARFMNPEFTPIPSSIIAEGIDIWDGAGDRGDAAMIAYGASRFALTFSDKETAKSLLPLIKWCLRYCEKQKIEEGVIASDSDELEGRFPAGKANLSTNMLTYGGYKSAANLLKSLDVDPDLAKNYENKAEALRASCDAYFGGEIMGYNTYKYFEGNTKLRSWICLPLTMGIFDRKEETLKALFSPELWSKDGIYTEAGNKTFWDRSTLYAFKGILFAGETDLAMKYFNYYSHKRLLGEHVPYAVEAWPEGGQRHLSAESGLYCRVVIEGLFGIIPTKFDKFTCSPRLPADWNYMKLKNIKAFNNNFDINVERDGNNTKVQLAIGNRIIAERLWDGISKLEFSLPN